MIISIKMFYLALVIAAVCTVGNVASVPGRIIGGEDAVIETYPYQVSVQKNGKHNCGGTILTVNFVLTATHCLIDDQYVEYTVRAGVTYRDQGGSVHRIDKITRNEETNRPGKLIGDIALVQLVEPLKFDKTRQPIVLFNATDKVEDGQPAVITGWGKTKPIGEFSKHLKVVTVPIINHQICKNVYGKKLKDNEICAGNYDKGGKDTCQGDSGGPLIVAGRLAGVVSWGRGCAQPKFPGVYAEIAYHRDWIKKYAGV